MRAYHKRNLAPQIIHRPYKNTKIKIQFSARRKFVADNSLCFMCLKSVHLENS